MQGGRLVMALSAGTARRLLEVPEVMPTAALFRGLRAGPETGPMEILVPNSTVHMDAERVARVTALLEILAAMVRFMAAVERGRLLLLG